MVALAYQASKRLPDNCGNCDPEVYGSTRLGGLERQGTASIIVEEESVGLLDCVER